MEDEDGDADHRCPLCGCHFSPDCRFPCINHGDECSTAAPALRRALAVQQSAIRSLQSELEAERAAAASSASEAMSMILRLQHERAGAHMDLRQFRRFVDDRMAHDQRQISVLEDLLFRRDCTVHALALDVRSLRHRILSAGLPLDDLNLDLFNYPPPFFDDTASLDTPRSMQDHIDTLDLRIQRLELDPGGWTEKGVVVKHSARPNCGCCLSMDSFSGSPLSLAHNPDLESNWGRSADEMSDRVYTVDTVHRANEDYVSTPREIEARRTNEKEGQQEEEVEIKKLYKRLEALEADRESMRQTIMSMGTKKANDSLLRQIAVEMCNQTVTQRKPPRKLRRFRPFFITAAKWVASFVSFVFGRKKPTRIRYAFGQSSTNVGLLLLLDRYSRMKHRGFLSRTQRRLRESAYKSSVL